MRQHYWLTDFILMPGRIRHMSAVSDALNAKVDALAASVKNIRQDIADIKASLPTDGGMSADEVAALSAKLDGVVSDAAELDSENPAAPAPAPAV